MTIPAAIRLALAALLLATPACKREEVARVPAAVPAPASTPAPAAAPAPGTVPAAAPAPAAPGRSRVADYQEARRRARAWLDALEVDPVELLKHGVKGKKKLGEILDAYWTLREFTTDPADRERIHERVVGLARQAARPEYHDMLSLDDREFTQNSMSYLRVAWLLSRFGLDTHFYREEILRMQPRLDEHLKKRGPWQQAMFGEYYDRFGLTKPAFLTAAPLADGVIARRQPAATYNSNATYDLTHEIFVAFDYGGQRTQTRFSAADLAYASQVLPELTQRFIAARNADLVGELSSCMTYLGLQAHPVNRQALDYLLDNQNANGTWGNYEAHRKQFGPYLEHHVYLHTTMVVLDALLAAYEGEWGRASEAAK